MIFSVHRNDRGQRFADTRARALKGLDLTGLSVVTCATVAAGAREAARMIGVPELTLADQLLLLIFLEVVARCGACMESGAPPGCRPMRSAIVPLARLIMGRRQSFR